MPALALDQNLCLTGIHSAFSLRVASLQAYMAAGSSFSTDLLAVSWARGLMALEMACMATGQNLLAFLGAQCATATVSFNVIPLALAFHEYFLTAFAGAIVAGQFTNVPARHRLIT